MSSHAFAIFTKKPYYFKERIILYTAIVKMHAPNTRSLIQDLEIINTTRQQTLIVVLQLHVKARNLLLSYVLALLLIYYCNQKLINQSLIIHPDNTHQTTMILNLIMFNRTVAELKRSPPSEKH